MALFKAVCFWNCRQRGWSETYYVDSIKSQITDSLDSVKSYLCNLMMTKRVKLVGKQCEFYAIRISRITDPKGSQLYYDALPQNKYFGVGNGGYDTDNPPSTLVVTMSNVDQSSKRQMHLRGIPDGIDQRGGALVMDDVVGFEADFNAWGDWMSTPAHGMIWIGKTVSNVFNVTNYVVVQDTNQIEFNFDGTPFAALAAKKHITARLSGLNYRNSELNGQLTLEVVDNNTAKTVMPYAVYPYVTGGIMRFNTTGAIDIRSVKATKIGSRDTGAPLLQPVGRGRARKHG